MGHEHGADFERVRGKLILMLSANNFWQFDRRAVKVLGAIGEFNLTIMDDSNFITAPTSF
jgi:hypothetical protein